MNYSELQNARSLLGVDKNATKEEVKKVFRRKALDTHPDTNFNDSKEEATAKMQELNKAKEILDKTYESDFVEPIDPQEETLKRQAEAAKRHREDDERRAEQQREWEKIKNQERTRAESQQKTTYTEEEPEKVSMPSKLNFGRGLHTNLEGSFSTFARNARFYNSVYPSFQKAIPTNLVLQEYLKLINERANQDFEKLFVSTKSAKILKFSICMISWR